MGNPSEGKKILQDYNCEQCGCILIGEDEIEQNACIECQREIAREIAQTSDQEHLLDYMPIEECIKDGLHLSSCDEDGYCNYCGEQDEE